MADRSRNEWFFARLLCIVIVICMLKSASCRRPYTLPRPFYDRCQCGRLQSQINALKQQNAKQEKSIQQLKELIYEMQYDIRKLQTCCSEIMTTTPALPTSTTAPPHGYIGTTSTEFAVMFQEPPPYDPIYLQILVAADRQGSLTLEDKLTGTTITNTLYKGLNALNISKSHFGKGNEIANKGMLLQSKFPITVYGMYRSIFSAEGFTAIPTAALGTKYVVMNTYNESLRYGPKAYKIMITAVNDSTTVSVKLNLTKSVVLFGTSYSPGSIFTTTINRLSTLHIDLPLDLSGSIVKSSKPVAVTSGGRCDWVIQTPVNCQPNFEYLPPINSWGTTFIVPAISQTPHYVLKILPSRDMTIIHVISGNSTSEHTLMADKFFEVLTPNEATLILSNNPIYVALYTETTRSMGTIMATVPADTQYANTYDVGFLDQTIASSFVCITIQARQLDGLRIDDKNISFQSANRSDIVFRGQTYTSVTLQVFNSFHRISHIDPEIRFGVIVYGFYHDDGFKVRAFGYPAGLRLPGADYTPQ